MKAVLIFMLWATCLLATDSSWDKFKQQTLKRQDKIPGWCKREKAEKMMDLIFSKNPRICVEIGVFGGSSVYPTAAALKYLNNGGVIYAIDPWSTNDCLVGYAPNDPNYQWWNNVNLEKIYRGFISLIENNQLQNFCLPIRMTSSAAAPIFKEESIDILHIDGNHTQEAAYLDAFLFLPKVKKGGYIWFDDVNWATTKKAVQFMSEHCELDLENSVGNECYLYRKP